MSPTMRAVRAERLDSIDDYRIVDLPVPAPGPGEVLVRVGYCGVGYADGLVALGRYQVKPPLPHVPGGEVGGQVAALGEGVSGFAIGDRVMASVRGGFAEYGVAPAAGVWALPAGVTLAQAAALRIDYLTALHALQDRAHLLPGERLLVLGAGGGVGSAAVQVGKALSAQVVAAASTDAKRASAVAQGADATVDTAIEGWRDRLKVLGKIDVVFDPVCGPLFEATFRSLGWGGRHLVIGFTGGKIPALPANLTLLKGAALTGADVRQFALLEPVRAATHIATLLEWAKEGRIRPAPGRAFALDDYAAALEFAMSGKGNGKTILNVAGELTDTN